MEFTKYEIQKEDTLSSIAEQNGTSVKELLDFHNQHCGITQQIIGDSLPKYLNFILTPNQTNALLIDNKKISDLLLVLVPFEKKKYFSKHTSQIFINESELTNFIQNHEFYLSLEKSSDIPKFILDVIDNKIDDGMEMHLKFDGLLEKIVQIKDYLEIVTDLNGNIIEVANKPFLQSKWNGLKEELRANPILQTIPADSFETMIEKGDLEFSNSYPLYKELKKSIFHFYLLYPFYNQNFKMDEVNILPATSIRSQLFSETDILLNTVVNITNDFENNEYIMRIESQIDKSKINFSAIESLYKNNYPFLKDDFVKYNCNVNALYAIDKDTFQIKFADIDIEEIVNNNLEAYQKLEIEMIS